MPVTDTSKKVKSVIKRRQSEGKWICSVPYGYVITNSKTMSFTVDEPAAEIVRKIYELYIDGWGYKKIANYLSGMREAGQKIANTFRTFTDKETVDYSEKEKKFSKTELVKKPFEAKKKLYQRMEQHLDEALDKVGSLAKELERMKDVEMAEPSILGTVAEPEFQYGADAFEAYQQLGKAETETVSEVKVQEIKGKSR